MRLAASYLNLLKGRLLESQYPIVKVLGTLPRRLYKSRYESLHDRLWTLTALLALEVLVNKAHHSHFVSISSTAHSTLQPHDLRICVGQRKSSLLRRPSASSLLLILRLEEKARASRSDGMDSAMIYRFESRPTKHPDPTTPVDLALGSSISATFD